MCRQQVKLRFWLTGNDKRDMVHEFPRCPDTGKQAVSWLRTLAAVHPLQAMEVLEFLIARVSVRDLSIILHEAYAEITEQLGIDWHFTALQWKLGHRQNRGFDPDRFTVWSFPFQEEGDQEPKARYTTCWPFQFQSTWEPRSAELAPDHI